MAKYVNGVEQEEGKSLQVEVFVKNGKVQSVNQSAQFGTKKMAQSATNPKVYECVGVYGRTASKVNATFELESLGTVTDKQVVAEGEAKEDSVKFDAMAFLDEPEKKGALDYESIKKLQSISVGELRKIAIEAHEDDISGWTALQAAAIAILNHEERALGNPPYLPVATKKMPMKTAKGDHADNAKATLTIGANKLTVGDKYFKFVGYNPNCEGMEKYSFTWDDVPVTYLDEPK